MCHHTGSSGGDRLAWASQAMTVLVALFNHPWETNLQNGYGDSAATNLLWPTSTILQFSNKLQTYNICNLSPPFFCFVLFFVFFYGGSAVIGIGPVTWWTWPTNRARDVGSLVSFPLHLVIGAGFGDNTVSFLLRVCSSLARCNMGCGSSSCDAQRTRFPDNIRRL